MYTNTLYTRPKYPNTRRPVSFKDGTFTSNHAPVRDSRLDQLHITRPVPHNQDGAFTSTSYTELRRTAGSADTDDVALGPNDATDPERVKLVL